MTGLEFYGQHGNPPLGAVRDAVRDNLRDCLTYATDATSARRHVRALIPAPAGRAEGRTGVLQV